MPRIPKYEIHTDKYKAVLIGEKHKALQWKIYRMMKGITIKYMPFITEGTADEVIVFCDAHFKKNQYANKE